MPYRILLADDSKIIRDRVRSLFEGAGWVVAEEAANGLEAVQKTKELKPDLVLLNISMPLLDGFQALPQIVASSPAPKVIIFTLHEGKVFRQRAEKLGAHGYIVKSQPLDDLLAEATKVLTPES